MKKKEVKTVKVKTLFMVVMLIGSAITANIALLTTPTFVMPDYVKLFVFSFFLILEGIFGWLFISWIDEDDDSI